MPCLHTEENWDQIVYSCINTRGPGKLRGIAVLPLLIYSTIYSLYPFFRYDDLLINNSIYR